MKPAPFDPLGMSVRASVRANESVVLVVREASGMQLAANGTRANVSLDIAPGQAWAVRADASPTVKGALTVTGFAPFPLFVGASLIGAAVVGFAWGRRRGRPSEAGPSPQSGDNKP